MSRASDYVDSLSAKNGDLYTLSPWEGTELEGSAAEVYLTSEDFLQVAARQDANKYISNKLYNYLATSGHKLPQFIISSIDYGFSEYESVVENINSTFDLVSLGKEPMLVAIRGYILDNYGENVKPFFMEMYTHLLCLSSATKLGIVPVLAAGNAMFEGAFVDLTVSKQGDSSQDGYFVDLIMLVYKVTWSSPENLSGYTSASIEYTVDSLDGYVTFITQEEPNFDMIGVTPAPVDTTAAKKVSTGAGSVSYSSSDAPVSTGLGSLSEKYEAGSKGSTAIGYDENSGTNYGKYQISSKQGTMGEFIQWAEKNGGANGKEVAERLRAAGPSNTGGKGGTMPEVWKQLATEGKLGTMEHDFIKKTHYDVGYNKIKDPELRKKIDSSPALQNVLWSTAVQHGPGRVSKYFSGVKGADAPSDIIDKVYTNRSAGCPDYSNRYVREAKDAQKALGKEINSSTAA